MSKIGAQPIPFDDKVKVDIQRGVTTVTGPLAALHIKVPSEVKVSIEDANILVKRSTEQKHVRALHGLIRSLIANAVHGVVTPWTKKLEVVGTGYRVKMQGEDLHLEVGYSHDVTFNKVEGVAFSIEGKNTIVVSGSDKQKVGEIAHKIKMIKKPDPYKGKGIRYEGEQLKLKPGKKAKGAGE